MDTTKQKKSRGAFFTPPEIAEYLAGWSIRSADDMVLEPSCGEASFLLAAARRLKEIGANPLFWEEQLHGVEIFGTSAREARSLLQAERFDARLKVGDFFEYVPTLKYDAVIGNPPFVRYQNFSGAARARSLEAALAQGVRLSGLASSWAAFLVKASLHLAPGGRLALVLPAELLSVKYAQEVRRFLLKRFGRIRLIVFEERVFPGVLEEIVLLLAEGTGGAECFELYQTRDVRSLQAVEPAQWTEHVPGDDEKWTPALLAPDAFTVYQSLTSKYFEKLSVWGGAYLGAVTGNNKFFSLTTTEAREHGLREGDVIRISPPGSRHLRGLSFTEAAWKDLAKGNARCLLLYPDGVPSKAAQQYIQRGEQLGAAEAYKCRVRRPWWRVPLVEIPDLFLTYMNHDRPRLVSNSAQVKILNSLYGVKINDERKRVGKDLLPIACLNSVTLLGSEIIGRSYGGGLLKMEPREADKLPVPSLALIERVEKDLRAFQPQLAQLLRQGDLLPAVKAVDRILLNGIPSGDLESLRVARETLFQRRRSRGKRAQN